MLTRVLGWSVVACFVMVVASAGVAQTEPPTCEQYDAYGVCVIWAGGGGAGGGSGGGESGGGSGRGAGGGSGNDAPDGPRNLVINEYVCTPAGPANPQPLPSDSVWGGHTDGAIYKCLAENGKFGAPLTLLFWAATPPAAPPPPDPRALAQQAIAAMNLKAVDIGIVPEDQPGRVGIIGMPTWMWAEEPVATTMGPITRTVSAGGFTVTATAKVTKVVWNMGDGDAVTCTGPGTPYADSYGKQKSPTCGHAYTRDGKYAVTATSYWTVEWSGVGESGAIPLDFSRSTTITMGEVQVIIQ